MKRALVCGAGGFIGSHLVRRLKQEGYWVRGADQKPPEFSPTDADEFLQLDLREPRAARAALAVSSSPGAFDEVYQLAADMGGMGFIHTAECEIMRNSALININMIERRLVPRRSLLLLLVGLHLPRHGARRAGDDGGSGVSGASRQRVRLGEAVRRAQCTRVWPSLWRCRSGLRASRTATVRKARGLVGARRRRRRSAERWPRRRMAERLKCGATGPLSDRTRTWMIWWTASIVSRTRTSTPSNIGSPEYVTVDELVRR